MSKTSYLSDGVQVCGGIKKVRGGWIVRMRWPYGCDVMGFGERACQTWEEVIEVLEKAALVGGQPNTSRHDCESWRCEGLGCQRCKSVVETAAAEADLRAALRKARAALQQLRLACTCQHSHDPDIASCPRVVAASALAGVNRALGEES